MWWITILFLTAVGLGAFYWLAKIGGEVALRRDREEHLRIVNEARRRSRLPPLQEHQLPEHPEAIPWGQEGSGPLSGMRSQAAAQADEEEGEVEIDASAELAPYVSIVLLNIDSPPLGEAALRVAAQNAWGIDLPSDNPADEEFVSFKAPPTGMVSAGGFRFMVHDNGEPYFHDREQALAGLQDGDLRQSVREATAWRGVDMLGVPDGLTKDNAYALIAKLALNLADETTVAIYVPEFRQLFPYDSATRRALASPSVIGSLRESHMI